MKRLLAALVLAPVLLSTGACQRAEMGAAGPDDDTVTVLAAASLTEAFGRIAANFEAAHPGTRVSLSFAGSTQLAQQINAGAPADVFAAASTTAMKRVTDATPEADKPVIFARNQLVIAVPEGNPAGVAGLRDLTRPGLKVAICAPQVPCGAAANDALEAAGVALKPVTLDQDVRSALAKVRLGEVDAALVYRTDVRAAEKEVDGVEFPESSVASNDYPILALPRAPHREGADAFVAYVLSDSGRRVLDEAGFAAS